MAVKDAKVHTPKQFAQNAVQRLLESEMQIDALRTNNILRKDEWLELDTRLVQVARDRLIGIEDLQARGLTHPLGGLGTLFSQYETLSDMTDAEVDMAGVTPGEEDHVEFDVRTVPVPIVHKDFRVNIRRLEASRKLGDTIDTTQGQVAARKVSDKLEDILFNGVGLTVDGNTIYGYTNHPDVNTGTGGNWSTTIDDIYTDVLDMISDAHDENMYGPYILYLASDLYVAAMNVYTDGSGETAMDRVLRIPQLQEVKAADALDAEDALLVQMTADTVDLAVAQDIIPIEWQTLGGMMTHFKVFCAMVPRIKSDDDGNFGVVYYSNCNS